MTERDDMDRGDRGDRGVDWEAELRAGQAQEAGAGGSVEPELAIVRLLRHSASPASLDAEALDRGWRELRAAFVSERPRPWWRRGEVVVGALGLVAAAAVVVFFFVPRRTQEAPVGDTVALLEQQFASLAPQAMAGRRARVDVERAQLRSGRIAALLAEEVP